MIMILLITLITNDISKSVICGLLPISRSTVLIGCPLIASMPIRLPTGAPRSRQRWRASSDALSAQRESNSYGHTLSWVEGTLTNGHSRHA